MKRSLLIMVCGLMVMSSMGCASLQHIIHPVAQEDKNAGVAPLPSYSGPKARIAVADFDVKAAKATADIGSGLRKMLITALVNSNRFSVVERQALTPAIQGQEMPVSGAEQPGDGGPQKEKTRTADLIVTTTVTEFEPQVSGGRAGIGGGGGVGSGVLGGLLGTALSKAHMALDIRIVDNSTSEILATTKLQGQASDVAGGVMSGFFGNWDLAAGLSAYANTPMEKAIRVCIIEAVRYIVQTIPPNYYK